MCPSRIPERRRDPRLVKRIPIKISCDDGDFVTETGNISRSGAYCRVDTYVPPMMKLKIQLLIPCRSGNSTNKKLSFKGVVVRTEPLIGQDGYNVAIFFNDISQKHSQCLTDFVNSHFENEG